MSIKSKYVAAGLALVQIPHGKKAPDKKGWNLRENSITTPKQAHRLNGGNVGLLHAYSNPPTCALDFDDLKRATEWFAERGVDLGQFLKAETAVRIESGRPNRSKLVYRLPKGAEPLPTIKLADGAMEFRCATANGLTVQDVLPPSIHPETGKPYQWKGDWRYLPKLPEIILGLWQKELSEARSVPAISDRAGERIVEGKRNDYLASLAGSMRRRGAGFKAILAALRAANVTQCATPLPRAEVRRIAKSVSRYSSSGSKDELMVRRMSDVEAKPIRWLWPGRIARGKVSLIVGHPGLGKSQVTASLSAVVTTNGQWPDASRLATRSGKVIVLSAEDDASDTMRPRFEAAGADIRKVVILDAVKEWKDGEERQRTFNIQKDVHRLRELATSMGGVALIVIDPVTAYLGDGIDSHRNADVRSILVPVSKLAEELGIAVVAVSHLNKNGGADAIMRITGSVAFAAAARAVYLVARDQDDPDGRLFLPVKNNIGNDKTGLAFTIRQVNLGHGILTSRVRWKKEPVSISADEVLREPSGDNDGTELDDASDWLRELLGHGPLSFNAIEKEAKDVGFSIATIRRAKKQLRARAKKRKHDGKWEWHLQHAQAGSSANDEHVEHHEHDAKSRHKHGAQHAQGAQHAHMGTMSTLPRSVTVNFKQRFRKRGPQ